MPEMTSEFRPAWWLPGPHLPTIWGKLARRRSTVHDRSERWQTPDGDHVTLLRMGQCTPGMPHLLVLHGLEARVTAKYAHGLLDEGRARGWSGDLLMFRSCDGEVNSARRFYHSGETEDLEFVVQRLIDQTPDIRLVMAGISLGGNVMLKWLGERGTSTPPQIERVAAASVPFDLEAGSRLMEHGFARVYVNHFLRTLKQKSLAKLALFPDLCDREAMLRARTFWEFDDALTAPLHGFTGAQDYYARSSSLGFLHRVARPALLLNAKNDPFLPLSVLEKVRTISEKNRMLTCEFSVRGGHVGWIEGQPWSERYYMEATVVKWLAGSGLQATHA